MYDTPFEITSTHADEISASVRLKGSYNGSDPGYPFPYEVELEWVLREGASLSITSTLWHQNAFEIPMAEGWHPYFTLGGKSDDWVLQFNTNRRMEYDAELLPTGQLIKDDRFLHGMSLAGVHLDNGFVWSEDEPAFQRCVLSNQDIVLTLLPDKSFPVLQVFTPDDRNSVALENLSGAPDNFNNHLLLISLAPGMQHQFTTCYVAAEKSGT
jgi:aldose 1-epimerase